MSEVRKYVLVNRQDEEVAEYDDYFEAIGAAEQRDCAIVTHIYEFSDSELTWTPDHNDTWPPPANDNEKGDNA